MHEEIDDLPVIAPFVWDSAGAQLEYGQHFRLAAATQENESRSQSP